MNNRLKASLEKAIQEWADKECESSDWPNGWCYEGQIEHMALAASLVSDASNQGQEFAENERE